MDLSPTEKRDSKLEDFSTIGDMSDEISNGKQENNTEEVNLLEEKQREADEYKARWVRAQADFENYKKRMHNEMSQSHLYAAEPFAVDILEVIDNFERALSSFESEDDPLYRGVYLIYQQLQKLMIKHGIREIDALHSPFDPNYHDAVMMVETDEYDEGTVVDILQKGYLYHSKVVRPSMVKVSK